MMMPHSREEFVAKYLRSSYKNLGIPHNDDASKLEFYMLATLLFDTLD